MMKGYIKWILGLSLLLAAVSTGLLVPVETYQKSLLGLLLLAIVAGALVVQVKNPLWGFAILIVTAVACPIEFGDTGGSAFSSPFPLAIFISGAWFFQLIVSKRRTNLDSSRAVHAALAIMAIALVAFLAGQFPWFPSAAAPLRAQVGGLGLFLASAGVFLAFGHQIKHLGHLKRITWLFLGAGAITCIIQVVPWLDFMGQWTTRPKTVGSLFWIWLAAVSFSQALLNRTLSTSARIFLSFLTALVLFRGFFQSFTWVSGWLPVLVALGVILFFRHPRIAICLALLAAPIGLILSGSILNPTMDHEGYSVMTRLEAWKVLWPIVEKSPLIGLGPANYYHYTQLYPIFGWYVRFSSHNNYADLIAQTGILGLLAFLWFIVEIFRKILRLRLQVPAGFARAYVVGTLGGFSGSLLAGMLGDWIIPFVYNIGIIGFRSSLFFWVFLGGILAMKRMTQTQKVMATPSSRRPLPSHAVLTNC